MKYGEVILFNHARKCNGKGNVFPNTKGNCGKGRQTRKGKTQTTFKYSAREKHAASVFNSDKVKVGFYKIRETADARATAVRFRV